MSIRPISKELQEIACKELNEDPNRLESDLEHIRDWLEKQPHLNPRKDDQWLVAFLRGCKFSLERAKEKLELYYTMKTFHPQLLQQRCLNPDIERVLDLGCYLPLKLPKTGGPEYILAAFNYEPNDFMHVMKLGTIMLNILMVESDNYAICGVNLLVDFKSRGDILKFLSPIKIKEVMQFYNDACPTRYKGYNFFNVTRATNYINILILPFLKEKQRKRVKMYTENNMDEMYQNVPKNILPAEYGGEGGTIAEIITEWKTKIKQYQNWFEDEENFKSDESKRLGKPKTYEDIFGVDGSFRQINVD